MIIMYLDPWGKVQALSCLSSSDLGFGFIFEALGCDS